MKFQSYTYLDSLSLKKKFYFIIYFELKLVSSELLKAYSRIK